MQTRNLSRRTLFLAVGLVISTVSVGAARALCFDPGTVSGGESPPPNSAIHATNVSSDASNNIYATRVLSDYSMQCLVRSAAGSWHQESITIDGSGAHTLVVTPNGSATVLYAMRSPGGLGEATRSGVTWSTRQLTSSSVADVDACLDASGTVHVVYWANGLVYYLYRTSDGVYHSTLPLFVTPGALGACAIALSPSGLPRIVYTDGPQLIYREYSGSSWNSPTSLFTMSGLATVRGLRLVADAGGFMNVILNYLSQQGTNRNYYFHGSGSSWDDPLFLNAVSVESDVSMAPATGGVQIAWHRTLTSGTQFVYQWRENGNWHPEVVVNASYELTGQENAMCVTAGGGPFIVYNQGLATNDQLLSADGTFLITDPPSPGGQPAMVHWRAGSTQPVTWVGCSPVDVQMSPDGGQTWTTIQSGLTSHTFNVTVPQWTTLNAWLRLDAGNGTTATVTNITIVSPPSRTWSSSIPISASTPVSSLALRKDGEPRVVGSPGTQTCGAALLSQTRAWQAGWSASGQPPVTGYPTSDMDFKLDASDYGRVAYCDQHCVGNDQTRSMVVDVEGPSGWTSEVVEAGGDVGRGCSLALDASGALHLSYVDLDHVRYSKRTGTSWSAPVTVAGDLNGFDRTRIAIDSNGYAWIAYQSGSGIKVMKSTISGWTLVATLNNMTTVFGFGLDTQNNPRIAYHDQTAKDLRFAQWGGSQWSDTVVESNGNVGGQLSMPATGEKVIAYQANGVLKLATWITGPWITEVVDTTGVDGFGPVLRLAAGNNPRILNGGKYLVTPSDDMHPAPAAISVSNGKTTQIVTWTAPGDDGNVGQAAGYELKWATTPITPTTLTGVISGSPQPAGSSECYENTGLTSCTTYYYALVTTDEAGNQSAISYASGTTKCSGVTQVTCNLSRIAAGGPEDDLPRQVALQLGSPLPAREGVDFVIEIPADEAGKPATLEVFDVAGRVISVLSRFTAAPGRTHVSWSARQNGQRLAAGVHFVRLRVGDKEVRRTVVLI